MLGYLQFILLAIYKFWLDPDPSYTPESRRCFQSYYTIVLLLLFANLFSQVLCQLA